MEVKEKKKVIYCKGLWVRDCGGVVGRGFECLGDLG